VNITAVCRREDPSKYHVWRKRVPQENGGGKICSWGRVERKLAHENVWYLTTVVKGSYDTLVGKRREKRRGKECRSDEGAG